MKKTIVHIIDNLDRGGAETMLVTVIKKLTDYNNIIVTLYPQNEFEDELKGIKLCCLNMHSRFKILQAALKLKRIIKENNADIVHSHLFWSTVVARMGTPKNIPLITTIHTFASTSVEYGPWRMKSIEKLTYRIRKSIIIAVSQKALEEYFNHTNVKPHRAYTLYTFVDTAVFNEVKDLKNESTASFRLVTVGNLKAAKNYSYLLEAFKNLRGKNISLDIYGKGPLDESLQKIIDDNHLNVTLKGQATAIHQLLNQYDLFVMSSTYEGFSLSVLEAMAMGMPMMLSDIVSFKEQCAGTAVYYDLNNTNDFVTKLLGLKNNKQQLHQLGIAAKQRVLENFTLTKHKEQLEKIYNDALVSS